MARPTVVPTWATTPTEHPPGTPTDETTDVVEPTSAFRALGWRRGSPKGPIRQYINWNLRKLGEWVDYLRNFSRAFNTLTAAAADLQPGEAAIVAPTYAGGSGLTTAAAPQAVHSHAHGASVRGIHTDVDAVYVCGAVGTGTKRLRKLSRDLATEAWSVALADTVNAVFSDGRYVFAVTSVGAVHCLDPATGAVVAGWNGGFFYDHNGALNAVVSDSTYVYVGGASATVVDGTGEVRALNALTGAHVWTSAAATAAVTAICAYGSRVWIGDSSDVIELAQATGAGTGRSFGLDDACVGLATDGEYLFTATAGGVDPGVYCRSIADLTTVVWSIDLASIEKIAVDDRYVVVAHGAQVTILDKLTGRTIATSDSKTDHHAVDTDGELVYVAGDTGSSNQAWAYRLPPKSRIYTRVSSTARFRRPFHKNLLPS